MSKNTTHTSPSTGTPLVVHGQGIERIVAARESDEDLNLLEGMIDQTFRMYRDRPGVDEALALGLRPYTDPGTVEGAKSIRHPGHRAVAYVRSSTLFLIWGGSAAKENDDGDNPYVSYLSKLVRSFRPEELLVSTFSRLVRSRNHEHELRRALENAGTKVVFESMQLDLATEHGQMLWAFLAMVFSIERDGIERRMALGRVFAARSGRWMFSEGVVPPGYELHLEGDTKIVRPSDEAQVIQQVRSMIEVLGSDASARRKAELLGRLGITTTRNVRGGTEEVPIDQAQPYNAIRRLNELYDVYRTGNYEFSLTLPRMHGVDEIAGVPVKHREEIGPDGTQCQVPYITLDIPVGLPEGGWADAAAFANWDAQRSTTPANPGGRAHLGEVKPLTRLCYFEQDGNEFTLLSDGRKAYQLRRRRVDPDRLRQGWYDTRAEQEVMAELDSATLHCSIADETRKALTSGASFVLASEASVGVDADGRPLVLFLDDATRRRQLAEAIDKLDEKAKRNARMAADSEDKESAAIYEAKSKELSQSRDRLAEQMEQAPTETVPPETVTAYGRTLLDALETLERIETTCPRDMTDAIGEVFSDLRFEVDDDTVTWSVDVVIPTDAGLVILRGVSGRVSRFCRTPRYQAQRKRDRVGETVMHGLAEGLSVDELHDVCNQGGARLSKALLKHAVRQHGLPASDQALLSHHPVAEARTTMLADRLGLVEDADLEEWQQRVLRSAGDCTPTTFNGAAAWADPRQRLLDTLAEANGPISVDELARRAGYQGHPVLVLGFRATRRKADPYVLGRPPQLATWTSDGFIARVCSCGATNWVPVRLPELCGLLCRSCQRDTDGVTFPVSYLAWLTNPTLASELRALRAPQAHVDAIPAGEFTMLEWADAAGVTSGALQGIRSQLLREGRLMKAGRRPRADGGMPPTVYRLVSPAEG